MLEDNLSVIATYLWKESLNNIKSALSSKEASNFNMNDYYYLTEIYELGEPNFSEVADKLKLTRPAISALVKRLEKSELITKKQDEVDRRIFYISLTEKAKKIVEGDNKIFEGLTSMFNDLLDEEELKLVDKLLIRVVEKLRNEARE